MVEMVNCPCGSGLPFAECCQPCHQGVPAKSAEALMRSRYSAFVVGDIDYIIRTTVPAQAVYLDRQSLQNWADEMTWTSLVVKSHRKIGKRHAQVHFVASYAKDDGSIGEHDELSAFVLIQDDDKAQWYFLDPTVPVSLTNKQPCLCGSGEKFKACCGKFLV